MWTRRTLSKLLKEQLRSRKIDWTDISQSDPQNNPDHIVLKGIPPASRSDLLSIVQDHLPEYDVTSGAGRFLEHGDEADAAGRT
jgi:hypothetical protein